MNRYTYLIVGGGMTGDAAAQGIREIDSSGTIGLVSAEPHQPYNRPPLSKGLWKGDPEAKIWRPKAAKSDVLLGRRIVSLDARGKRATDDKGTTFEFEKLQCACPAGHRTRSEEHTSDSSHSQISYAVFCLKKKNKTHTH